jgi:cytochrome c peroxidase
MKTRSLVTVFAIAALAGVACEKKEEAPATPKPADTGSAAAPKASADKGGAVKIDPAMLAIFQALPEKAESKENPSTPEKIALGKQLYFDARLSKNHDVSCNSCHLLDKYGVDGKKVSEGHKKQTGDRNAPTVYNAAIQFVQFWDGRAKDVEEQATKPITNPKEMAMPDEKAVVAVLKSIPEYEAAFKKAFPEDKDPVTLVNVGKAIGAFERTLLTPTKWDKYLAGDKTALNEEELKGLKTYLDTGCQTCHMGAGLGGTMYQKLGLLKPWPDTKDQGRFQETKQEADKMMFKVPLLRNVEKTAPYYHDGSQATLEEAVKSMAEYQLGKNLDDGQVKSIVTFLKTLTAEPLPADAIKAPELPKSTAKTPKPNPN